MQIKILDQTPSILHQFVNEIREENYQKNAHLFRNNLKRIGEIMAYEISRSLAFEPKTIKTVLGDKKSINLVSQPVIISILRAGLALHQGFLSYFDHAENGFISANRINNNGKIIIDLAYKSLPNINNKTLIIADPMLATGHSMVKSLQQLLSNHSPTHIHIATVVAAPEGISYLKQNFSNLPVTLWVASKDDHLNEKAYIIPGLGDAGDLAYGPKQ
ncbi:uracil phosphoribosyltransferase [Psychroflexus sp. ALD_RP9]|uniref:uracil phosphoribosyltransferase n=1 Tax=Psychroflexus sp. ALD_RP9 TaxID=2777186 RepID=UPI001A8C456B|nr:uracil phosphoribosyltransferase [Psychroflexus sp. ALD_RP9]QSS97055.1 uracil phosphoribosyltransferase [Psychroflexus sp. ALD_RP9]